MPGAVKNELDFRSHVSSEQSTAGIVVVAAGSGERLGAGAHDQAIFGPTGNRIPTRPDVASAGAHDQAVIGPTGNHMPTMPDVALV